MIEIGGPNKFEEEHILCLGLFLFMCENLNSSNLQYQQVEERYHRCFYPRLLKGNLGIFGFLEFMLVVS